MEITQTVLQKTTAVEPTPCERLDVLDKRVELADHGHLKEDYIKLKKGLEGEEYFEKLLLENSEPDWLILKNIWLDYNGVFECDFLVITQAGAYLFEIKNYTGKYEYRESQWFRYGRPNSHNPLSQIQKAMTNVEHLFKKLSYAPNLKGVLVFIGEFNPVQIQDEIGHIQIVQRSELQDLFWRMKQEERNYMGYSADSERFLKELAQYEVVNPYQTLPISAEVFKQLKPGICCSRCANFELERKSGFYICPCGLYEPKDHAILRTICEYGCLHPEENFQSTDLAAYFGEDLSKRTLIRVLNKYFQKVGVSRTTEYVNEWIRPSDVKEAFQLTESKFLRIN